MIDELVGNFDAEDNETDRLIYYKVTGRETIRGEFGDEFSSDEEWSFRAAPNPLAYLFSSSDKVENENQVALIGTDRTEGGYSSGDG